MLLSDLHHRIDWFEWIADQAADFDIVAIGGDLLNGFDGLLPQMEFVRNWADQMMVGCACLALASGNHDGNHIGSSVRQLISETSLDALSRRRLEAFAKTDRWMDVLARPGRIVVDGVTDILTTENGEQLIVTCIPWDVSGEKELWEVGAQVRDQTNAPWLVLHHEAPGGTLVGGTMGNFPLFYHILEFHPAFVLSGHFHDQPYRKDGSFADHLEGTWCFNPGHPLREGSAAPNHIILDTKAGTAEWHGYDTANRCWQKKEAVLS